VKAIAEQGGFRPEVSQKVPSLTTIIGLVAAGSGVAIVPESPHYMNVPSVVFRPLADIELVSELAVAYQRDERSPAVNCFLVTRLKITDSKSVYVGQTAARAASSTSIMKSASALVMHKGGLIRRVFA
jgi:LysR substrate binding domain